MKRIPTENELEVFKKKKLRLICFAEYQVFFHFENDAVLTVDSPLQHLYEVHIDEVLQGEELHAPKHSALMRLLGFEVLTLSVQEDVNLEFHFSNGDLLKIFRNEEPYESYHICCGKIALHF